MNAVVIEVSCLLKAKKRQSAIEETYQGAMRDLDHLLVSFQINDSKKRSKWMNVSDQSISGLWSDACINNHWTRVRLESFLQVLICIFRTVDFL